MTALINYCLLISTIIAHIHANTLQTFLGQSPITHIVEFNNTYFIGSTNYIYHVDASFRLLQTLKIGPVRNEDNKVTLLLVSPDNGKPVIFWCGSLQTGLCHANLIKNLNAGDFLDENFYAEKVEEYFDTLKIYNPDERRFLNFGVYGHIGSKAGTTARFVDISKDDVLRRSLKSDHMIVVSGAYDGRYNLSLPRLAYYTLRKTAGNDYYIRPALFDPSIPSFSWLSMHNALIHRYPIHPVSMFEHGDYMYMVVKQKINIATPWEIVPFHTRIARFNKTDIKFTDYVEAPITCYANNHDYDIVTDAVLADAGDDVLKRLGSDAEGKILYLLQGESSKSASFPTTNSGVICALPLSDIDTHLDVATRKCHRGKGNLVQWYYGQEKSCRSMVRESTLLDSESKTRKFKDTIYWSWVLEFFLNTFSFFIFDHLYYVGDV